MFRPKTISPKSFLDTQTFPHFQIWTKSRNVEMSLWKRLYSDVFTLKKKMAKIGVSIIVSIPHCPTNDDKILETGQKFPHFQKIDTIKKCGYVSK